MASNDFAYLLRILRRLERGPATWSELRDYLHKDGDEGESKHKRTFQRYIHRLEDEFGTTVKHNRRTGKYEIVASSRDALRGRILEAYELVQAVRMEEAASPYILFDARRPLGMEHFAPLLDACRGKKALSLTYRKFRKEPTTRTVFPYGLKEAQGRWYLVARDGKDGVIKTFSLDRILGFEETKESFTPFDGKLESLFEDAFGVYDPDEVKATVITLRFAHFQAEYVMAYPLHASQKVTDMNEEGVFFQLFLKPTHDFQMELLSYGDNVEVISPMYLRMELAEKLEGALEKYEEYRNELI